MRIDPRKFFELLFLLMLGMCLLFIYLRNIGGQRAVQLYGGAGLLVCVADAGEPCSRILSDKEDPFGQ